MPQHQHPQGALYWEGGQRLALQTFPGEVLHYLLPLQEDSQLPRRERQGEEGPSPLTHCSRLAGLQSLLGEYTCYPSTPRLSAQQPKSQGLNLTSAV